MLRRIAVVFVVAVAGLAVSGKADARRHHQIFVTPFFHAPCSVLSHSPCTPYFCSVLNHGPCIPEIDYPYGENLQLTVESKPSEEDAPKYQTRAHPERNVRVATLAVASPVAGRNDLSATHLAHCCLALERVGDAGRGISG